MQTQSALAISGTRSRLYRQYFTPDEIRRLDAAPPDTALSDIYVIRAFLARVLAAAARIKLTLKQRLAMLAAFCQAALTLASLVRIEFKLQPEPVDPLLEMIVLKPGELL